jgi:hypothetical protein
MNVSGSRLKISAAKTENSQITLTQIFRLGMNTNGRIARTHSPQSEERAGVTWITKVLVPAANSLASIDNCPPLVDIEKNSVINQNS